MCRGLARSAKYASSCASLSLRPNHVWYQNRNGNSTSASANSAINTWARRPGRWCDWRASAGMRDSSYTGGWREGCPDFRCRGARIPCLKGKCRLPWKRRYLGFYGKKEGSSSGEPGETGFRAAIGSSRSFRGGSQPPLDPDLVRSRAPFPDPGLVPRLEALRALFLRFPRGLQYHVCRGSRRGRSDLRQSARL